MERTKKELNIRKFFNRFFSYVILLLGIFSICYCSKKIFDYAKAKKETSVLEERLNNLKESNDRLGLLNSKLKDKNYFSVYVKDKYQYSSNSDSIIPID